MRQNKRFIPKGLTTLAALILILSIIAGCGNKTNDAAGGKPADVLVTYKDGGKITRGEFDTFLNINKFFYPQYKQFADDPNFQQEMMKQLVTFTVLAGRADDKLKAEADKKIKIQMDQIHTFFGSAEELEKKLKDSNLTSKDVEQFVQRSMYAIAAAESKVADQQVKEAYNQKIAQNSHEYDVATVRHILIETTDPTTGKEIRSKDEALKIAKEVQDKLAGGGDFDALAKQYSEDPGSKDNGGKYENADISQWEPSFGKAAAELPLNKISDPVETVYGYHIMKVESRSTKPFDAVKESIKSGLAEAQVYDFVDKELPGLIETNNLPKPEDKPAQTPNANAPTTEAPKTDAPAGTSTGK